MLSNCSCSKSKDTQVHKEERTVLQKYSKVVGIMFRPQLREEYKVTPYDVLE